MTLTTKQLDEILNTALKTGADFAEIFIEESNQTSLFLEDNKIEKTKSGTDRGVGIRLIKDKTVAYCCSSDDSFPSLRDLALRAAASFNDKRKTKPQELRPKISNMPYPIVRRPNEVPTEEKTAILEILNRTARSYGDKVKQVSARYMDSNQAITIVNSDGLYVEDNRIRTRYYVNVIAARDGILQTGYEAPGGSCGFELLEEFPPEEMARQAAERAILMLDAKHAPAGKMQVVLASEAGGTLIHEACGHAFEADFIVKGTSVYMGKKGKKVASPLITVYDDGTLKGKFGTYRFDDEGTPSHNTILIENGILKNYMSDYLNAKILDLPRTGNGRRESYRSRPIPRMTNTYIAPGQTPPKQIIDSVKEGLLVKKMGGGEVNVTNGDFVFEVTEGYLIEKGKVKYPVRGAIIIGNGPQILESIDMVGEDLEFQTGVCGKFDHAPVSDGQPTIRIPEIVVGGRD
ncbi:MAG: TldD/PmbA family protein [Candidatus Margulisbacteria bacterium]|nr:TldD/PmbA family protein [Candidatus Margulisiibacteriota bacterium]MBU1022332.1 TldD/PmbA family protein [Candidatus Margulisiibacteriota bacterium]MBU1729582.1 TldD/PmbA family protein [Candidatus Margulisiibacteriota bacterium]MBU1955068.1 TldD/PmbA family protein [Candidatus Margulisiibacteriota bacterium]